MNLPAALTAALTAAVSSFHPGRFFHSRSPVACSPEAAMVAAGKKEKTTKKKEAEDARSLKHEEAEERVKEEAPRARSEPEAPDGGGGSPDYSEDGDYEEACVASSHEAAMGVVDKKEKGTGKEVKRSGEEEEGKEEAAGAGYGLDDLDLDCGGLTVYSGSRHEDDFEESLSEVVKSTEEWGSGERDSQQEHELHSLSQQLFNGRQESKWRDSRLGLLSDGPMVDETLGLLKDCGLPVERNSPQQYIATIPKLPNTQVFFQCSKNILRNLSSGHLDIGIVGLHTVSEYGQGKDDLKFVDHALGFAHCRLSLMIPKNGIFERINSVKELAQMRQWDEGNPLIVATDFNYLGTKFMQKIGLKHVRIATDGGRLEILPAMGTAHVILDLVSSATTLWENNLKEIEGGTVLESQAVLVASRKSLVHMRGALNTTRVILERLEARCKAVGQFMVTTRMTGTSAGQVAEQLRSRPLLSGLQDTIVRPVICIHDQEADMHFYEIVGQLSENVLDSSVQELRAIGCGKVLVSPLVFIFDKESAGWQQLLSKLRPQSSVDSAQVS